MNPPPSSTALAIAGTVLDRQMKLAPPRQHIKGMEASSAMR
ncbi:MAG: hypothetical protein ACF788_01965 [Novipirellula sp. JB048]